MLRLGLKLQGFAIEKVDYFTFWTLQNERDVNKIHVQMKLKNQDIFKLKWTRKYLSSILFSITSNLVFF